MLTKYMPDVFDCGISAEDLVNETLEQFFDSPDGLGWKPSKSKLETFLCLILRRRFIDHWRRQKYVAGSVDEENAQLQTTKSASAVSDPYQEIEYKEFANLMRAAVKGDQELEDFITASEMIHDGQKVNQQLAAILDVTPAKVVNLKKRLINNKTVKDLYEQRRKK